MPCVARSAEAKRHNACVQELRPGTLWAIEPLVEPIHDKFDFHFCKGAPTNNVNRPEWYCSYAVQAIRCAVFVVPAHAPLRMTKDLRRDHFDFLVAHVQPLLKATALSHEDATVRARS